MKINQINGTTTTLGSQNSTAIERSETAPDTTAASRPTQSATWQSTVATSVKDNSQDIDAERVEKIRSAIEQGEFAIDAGKIADGLIEESRHYSQH